MVPAFAFALPTTLSTVSPTPFVVSCLTALGDGVNNSELVEVDFTWDVTQSVADNIANLKTAIVNQAASQVGVQILTSNVSVLMAVS